MSSSLSLITLINYFLLISESHCLTETQSFISHLVDFVNLLTVNTKEQVKCTFELCHEKTLLYCFQAGAGCSKLTTSLVNFLLKCKRFSYFSNKNTSVFNDVVNIYLMS